MSDDTQARDAVVDEFVAAYDGLCEAVAASAEGGHNPHEDGGVEGCESCGEIRAAKPAEGEHNGMPWKVCLASESDQRPYPDSDTHLWGCWPVLAIETGGYNDVEVIDPFTQRRLWIGNMWTDRENRGLGPIKTDAAAEGRNTAEVLRRIADVLEATSFLEAETQAPVSRT